MRLTNRKGQSILKMLIDIAKATQMGWFFIVRVISGTAKGMKLRTVDSQKTRPTLDRVKEAMFSMIQFSIPGALVLDLFSGNGSLGIEALSRGAAGALLNDYDPVCVQTIRGNLIHTGFSGKAELLQLDYREALQACRRRKLLFDLILLDPPYRHMLVPSALCSEAAGAIMQEGGLAVAEHDRGETMEAQYGIFRKVKTKYYGTVGVSVYIAEK